jgi:A/G-specific adenine glycosylase
MQLTEGLFAWFQAHGRHDLPWQKDPTAYRVWISEIMLQQTQVATVIPYYQRFMKQFPSVDDLAAAPIDTVLHLWSGLGYYARARNLHKTALLISHESNGVFPDTVEALQALPGIGRSTAGAIVSLAFDRPAPILDGNVKRVLTRYHGIEGWPGTGLVAKQLWELAEAAASKQRPAAYTQAIMDLGATVCTRRQPACNICPFKSGCRAAEIGNPHDFPTSRPKRFRPTRHQSVIVAQRDDGAVLLERRPDTGVWGGLWSFPELAADDGVEAWSQTKLGTQPLRVERLETLNHTFTHFELVLEPVLIAVAPAAVMDRPDWLWYKLGSHSPQAVGLPAPVRTLLDSTHREAVS